MKKPRGNCLSVRLTGTRVPVMVSSEETFDLILYLFLDFLRWFVALGKPWFDHFTHFPLNSTGGDCQREQDRKKIKEMERAIVDKIFRLKNKMAGGFCEIKTMAFE